MIRHGMSDARFYKIWKGVKARCLIKSNTPYRYYGARGIKVCDRWLSFSNFKEDMYESYLKHAEQHTESNTSIDRIDVDGNYEPSNCRWATDKQQFWNKRTE